MSDFLDVEQEKSLIRCTYKCFNLKKTIVEMVELNNISSLVVFNIIIRNVIIVVNYEIHISHLH